MTMISKQPRLLSSIIEELQADLAEHGDIPVVGENMRGNYAPVWFGLCLDSPNGSVATMVVEIDEDPDKAYV